MFLYRFIGETARPIPKKSDILVRVKAAGLNRADTLQRKGKYPAPKGESEIMGLEVYVSLMSLADHRIQGKSGFSNGRTVFRNYPIY